MKDTELAGPSRAGFRTGQVVGRYRLLGLLGAGGMGEVYEAAHVAIDRKFAVKLLRPEYCGDGRASMRLEREARIVGALECEQIVTVLDHGQLDDGSPYLVMERLRGDDLKGVLKIAGKLSLRRSVAMALDACRGLAAAHRAGLVHRDLKPANLFLCRRSSGEELCKILDFGIARQTDVTTSGNVLGTARYMAPEQIVNAGNVTSATDLYALGAILYECLSGRRLHDGDSIESVLFSVIHDEPPSLREACPGLPERVYVIVERLIAKRAEARYQSALELQSALEDVVRRLTGPAGARLPLGFPSPDRVDDTSDTTLEEGLESTGGPVSVSPRRAGSNGKLLKVSTLLGALVVGGAGYGWGAQGAPRGVTAQSSALPSSCVAPAVTVSALDEPRSALPIPTTSVASAVPPSALAALRKPQPAPLKAAVPRAEAKAPPAASPLFVAQNPYQTPAPAQP